MDQTVLVGSTGFVGQNLMASRPFDRAYHSTDIQEGFGRENGLVVYAGVPAAMFLANRDPQADLAIMENARENLRRLAPKKVVLVSSICVYADSRGKTEADKPTGEGLLPYGSNRLRLEQWVREDWPDALIVRLPALYGLHLKKNFLYDLHTVTPGMLREDKYAQLSAKSPLVERAYTPGPDGFCRLSGAVDPVELRAWFAGNDWNALNFTDSRSVYQFYDLAQLWEHIGRGLELGLTELNLATPPVSAAQVYRAVTGKDFVNELPGQPFDYDLRTRFDRELGGREGYLCSREEELDRICRFMERWAAQDRT